jgi:antitoxin component YwqK of YwqJK toxin-antitoxin module
MKTVFMSLLLLLVVFNATAQTINKTDAAGKKQGPWEKKYPNSKVAQYKGQFKDDKPVGTFTYYFPSNTVKAIVVHNEKTGRSVAKMFHENGTVEAVGIYKNQLKDSVWDYFGPTGRQSIKESYVNGLLNGTQTVYYVPEDPSSKVMLVAKTSQYTNGKLNGEVIEYYQNGVIKSKANFVNGVKTGVAIVNHPNGVPMMKERYKNGVQHGWQTTHDQNGKEIGKKYYSQGELLTGARLTKHLQLCKEKGINPNG